MRLYNGFTILLLLSSACAMAGPAATAAPDTGRRVVADHGAIASADPAASEAGLAMLRAGGNAIDAAVAAAFAIGVVEPQMSGVGGSGAMTIWVEAERRAEFIDFYAAQNADTYRAAFEAGRIPDGRPGRGDLRITGVPGNVAGLLAAHERFGRLTREQVMAPAIELAEQGFPVSQVLADFIISSASKLDLFEPSASRMRPDGKPLTPGQRLRNPELTATLRRIAERGRAGFYEGETAREVVAVMNAGGNPVTLADLAGYTVQWKRPLCSDYRGSVLLSAPPPQSGSQVLHTLELLEPYDLPAMGLPTQSATAFDVLAGALRVGIADNRANSDPNWEAMPAAGIVSSGFARDRAPIVGATQVPAEVAVASAREHDADSPPPSCAAYDPWGRTPEIPAGPPVDADAGGAVQSAAGPMSQTSTVGRPVTASRSHAGEPGESADHGETTHISVVDADGNAVSLTQTNSTVFGSGASAAGFFLNDSGFIFTEENLKLPALSPWRTRTTTISPTIVLRDGRVEMVVGAPGGGLIPTSIVQTMVYTMDYGMDPLDAVRMPRLFPTPNSPAVQLEVGFNGAVLEQVASKGWAPIALAPGYARLYMIVRRGGHWIAVADPRHNGEARGY